MNDHGSLTRHVIIVRQKKRTSSIPYMARAIVDAVANLHRLMGF